MKTRTVPLLSLALALAVWAPSASAQSLAGRWVIDVNLDAGSGQAIFEFQVEGASITGSYSGILGEQPITGTVEGSAVQFGFESDDAGVVTFQGVLQGNTLEGTCVYGLLGSGTFAGTRAS